MRFTVGGTGHRHEAAHALHKHIVARPLGVGARVTKPRDRAVDKTRIGVLEIIVSQAVLCQTAKLKIFDEHIRLGDELAQQRLTVFGADIDRDRALVRFAQEK